MSKTLGGFAFARNAIKYDYCAKEAIESMLEFCDMVSIAYVESEDETLNMLKSINTNGKKLVISQLDNEAWNNHRGKEKLAIFQNYAIEQLDTDYQFLCQMDEIVHESCYDTIRQAMKTDMEGFLISRINLWGDPMHQLNVPHYRKPCSTEVIRLTKRGHPTYGDGESINAQAVDWFVKSIFMVHYGFVRDRKIQPSKIREMQGNIFECGVDHKLDGMDVFDGSKWFDPEKDLKPIDFEHPKIMKDWILPRM
jgi:hypothetical protein